MDEIGTNTTQAGPRAPRHVNPSAMLSGGAVSYQKPSNEGYTNEEPAATSTSDSGSVPSLLDINPFKLFFKDLNSLSYYSDQVKIVSCLVIL